jgi:hypothetical protein
MTTKRDTILDNIVTCLKSITVANGFSVTVNSANVVRKMLFWDQVLSAPALCVLGGEEIFYQMEGQIGSLFTVKILAYSKNTSDPQTGVCNLIGDVIKALDSSTYNPSHSKLKQFVRVRTDEGWLHGEEGFEGMGLFELYVQFEYVFAYGSP